MGWYDHYSQELSNKKPLFVTIYAIIFLGIVLTSCYVFIAIYSGKPFASTTTTSTSTWFFSPSSSSSSASDITSTPIDHTANLSASTPEGGVSVTPSLAQSTGTRPIWEVPPGAKMPPQEAFQLTKALVESRVKDNTIIVTFGNYAFEDFILNWVRHLTDLGLSNLLVGAMDTKLLEALYWKGVPVFDMGSNMSVIDVGWGSATFHKMGREKVILIDAMLPFGYELLMCDTDMVWLKDPLPFFSRFPGADVLTSTDQVIPTVVDERLEVWQQVHGPYNIGIFHWRPTASAKKLAKEWKEMLLADDKIWDQNGFNQLVQKQLGPSVDAESGLVYAYDGNLKLGMLPASIFCSGHTYFVQAMYQQLRLEAYAVHTTFQFAGTEGKRHRLREAMVFNDEPEYYDSPGAKPAEDSSDRFSWDSNFRTLTDHSFLGTYAGGFLSFKASIPKSLLLEGEHNIESHFSLVNYQMKQIRTALAIASLLNRTLVMPPLWCRLDRLWFPHPGVLPGTMTRQPFLCPLDHVFEVNVMLKKQPEEEFGPGIDFKEYSFLDNPLLPKQVKESWLEVQLCEDGSENCQLSNETSRPGILRFPKHANEEMFKTVFSSSNNIKVIQFSSMQDAFQGFTDKVQEDKFRNRVKRYTSIWCCMENQTIGHIYYDMYWDEKPGWRPVPPQSPADDHPPW